MTVLTALLLTLACGDGGGDGDESRGSGETGMTGEPTGGGAPDCADYCAAVTTTCVDANAQYYGMNAMNMPDAGMTACMHACAGFEPGESTTVTTGNTVGCRTYHAGAAASDPGLHCPHAGPGGADQCGSNCDGFCAVALAVCADTYASLDACTLECAGFPDTEPYDASDVAGDTLACRLYHLTAAAVDPATHCGHIVADSLVCTGA